MPTTKFTLWREQRVLLARVKGSWNRLTAEDFSTQFKAEAAPLCNQPWAHIVYLDDWQLGVPEMEPVIQDLVGWCIQHQLRYVAQVYCPSMIKKYQLDKMIRDSSPGFEKRVYPSEQEAFAWLVSVGFGTDSASLQQAG
ncbi:hypothetical protein QWY20_15280 [Alkalimonas sp. MEB108]|uniref:STAS/SEC14 domain-containing protein n=1 Tax=Alkalimonas cellulosilytica TaxID=3058395 RepID=A0ABU7J924_9GAMM|nr:hypothetical protein [Alkalimonas sp. MEB108]MEE2002822.1 hypothetical protein [Alkalimonas sp. MEB108]